MILSQKQIDDLNKVANKLPIQRLISYAKDGTITEAILAQLTTMNSERRAQLLAVINDKNALKEDEEWEELDKNSAQALTSYLRQHPNTGHLQEIDNYLWNIVENNVDEPQKKNAIRSYLQLFPNGMYEQEAKSLLGMSTGHVAPQPPVEQSVPKPAVPVEHQKSVSSGQSPIAPAAPAVGTAARGNAGTPIPPSISSLDLVDTWDWMAANPNDANYGLASQHFTELKEKEIATMHEQLSAYSPDRVLYLLEKGIVSKDELLREGLVSPESLKILNERDDILDSLPDINVEIAKCHKECAEDHTDVFLFGIPSTGKTCILMGLIGSSNININTVRAGGPYACVLEQFLDAGLTIGQTPKDFVATIEASIQDDKGKHLINLVEMAGEDFAFKIADNENGMVSFEDIGAGATKLLCNNNKKSFFIIIDPTAKRVAFNHLVNETDADGHVRTYLVRKNVNQKIILKRLIDLLAQPENKKIMKNVDSISIVITKADLLGSGQEREEEAYSRFMDEHKKIIGPIVELCRENGINAKTNGQPMLYTFSLGRFYVGGVYQYDPTDADKLIEVLKGNTEINKKGTFGSKFTDIT